MSQQSSDYAINTAVDVFQDLRPVIGGLISAAPDAALAGACFITWIFPPLLGENMVTTLSLLMLLEFIIVHSSAFMGAMLLQKTEWWRKVIKVIALGVFYSLFVGGFALSYDTWWPLISFWGLTANRLIGFFVRPISTMNKDQVWQGWAISGISYVCAVGVSTVFPLVPAFGITDEIVRGMTVSASGLWMEEPQRFLLAGMLYFGFTALVEVGRPLWDLWQNYDHMVRFP